MLHLIRDLSDRFFSLLKEDPVRPHIPHEQRLGKNKDIFVLEEQDIPGAITCVSYQTIIPENETMLFEVCETPNIAVFYTIWSYESGKGRQLIFDSVNYIKEHRSNVEKFVTLSPKTDMASRFHLRNGARVLRENHDTINYVYELNKK